LRAASGLAPTSTMRAWPRESRWVRPFTCWPSSLNGFGTKLTKWTVSWSRNSPGWQEVGSRMQSRGSVRHAFPMPESVGVGQGLLRALRTSGLFARHRRIGVECLAHIKSLDQDEERDRQRLGEKDADDAEQQGETQ